MRRRGFTRLAQVDLRAELGRRVGANVAPHVIVLALNPAITVRILRSDPAGADLALAVIVLRETDTGTAIEVPAPAEPTDAMTARAVETLHSRVLDVIKEAIDRRPLTREPS
ncbi:hypothetical protein [Actinoplanes solisilvae]|uniref:hypothetical protein n=1 Tax=Actinoplanes solisilvae TaxID=2486853 RepID=UPI000FDBAA2E|nr:hypothetical protein [Actinoplanes solisilvae]